MGKRAARLRRGTTAVEFAVVAPIAIFLLLATMVGSQGVFRYQQVAALARDASRWASVHGAQYAQDTGNPAATSEDIYESVILPQATTLKPEHMSYQVSWDKSNLPLEITDDVQNPVGNTVTVTVSYQWLPEIFLLGPINLTSSSTVQMNY